MKSPLPTLGLLLGALLFFVTASPGFSRVQSRAQNTKGYQNLRQIELASLIYAQNNRDRLPQATDIWDYAKLLSSGGGLDDARIWQLPNDPANRETSAEKSLVLLPAKDGQPRELNPDFVKLKPSFAVAIGPRMNTSRASTTPIAWTRGLRPDGTWAPHSPYGTAGGHIVFIGGNVMFYKTLANSEGGELERFDGKGKTANILETLPPGTRISEYVPTASERFEWSQADRALPTNLSELIFAYSFVPVLAALWASFILVSIRRKNRHQPGALTILFWPFMITLLFMFLVLPTLLSVR